MMIPPRYYGYVFVPLCVWILHTVVVSWTENWDVGLHKHRSKPSTNATAAAAALNTSTTRLWDETILGTGVERAENKSETKTNVSSAAFPAMTPKILVEVPAAVQWSDVFPSTEIAMGDLSPSQFHRQLSGLSSLELSNALQNGELQGRHIRSWLLQNRSATLKPDEDDVPAARLARIYGYDKLGLFRLEQAFVGSDLYQRVAAALCAILTERGTHTFLLGDSTLSRLTTAIDGMMKDASTCRNTTVSISHREDTAAKKRTGYYHIRAFNKTWEKVDYAVPEGTKRALVIANFDGLHALSLYPSRKFATIPWNGQRFFDAWDDFIRYQLQQVSQLPAETILITTNVNSVDTSRMEGRYKNDIVGFRGNRDLYTMKCSRKWKVPTETCLNSVFTNEDVDFLNERLRAITAVDVDVNALTKNKGYLSGLGDGRHYGAIGRLKVAQFIVVYMLRRIEGYLQPEGSFTSTSQSHAGP